jgi:hypothetical protein
MSLSVNLKASVRGTQDSALDLGTAIFPIDISAAFALTDGTGADQANKYWSDTRPLVGASTSEDLDLAGGLTDAFGNVITLTKLKALYFKNTATSNSFTIGRPAANGVALFGAASDFITIPPGGVFLWVAPDSGAVAVTAGTADLLTITHLGSGTHSYSIAIVGVG